MESTPTPVPVYTPITTTANDDDDDHHLNYPQSHPVSKLPIKRKTQISPDSNSNAFKFHRIWTEGDEILFLQSLINSPPLSFPRDLPIFFNRFLNSIPRPYSKSQLSDKLRRLRNKWRLLSTRLSEGLDLNRLSPHHRMLFQLSDKLWHPRFATTSPFASPVSMSSSSKLDVDFLSHRLEGKSTNTGDEIHIGNIVAKTLVDVFDDSFEFVKSAKRLCYGGPEPHNQSFDKRWQELRLVEMEVLAQRFRLVVEDSIIKR